MQMLSRTNKAFSLQEMLVVVAIIAVMVVILITTGTHLQKQAKIKAAENTLAVLSTALEKYHLLHGEYPFEAEVYLPPPGATKEQQEAGYRKSIEDLYKELVSYPEITEILNSIPDKFLTAKNAIGVINEDAQGNPVIRIVDPWGQPYRYIYEDGYGTAIDGYGTAIIESAGPDGQWGIDADDEKSFDNISY
jgi:prepilin-type N-terminal cleavage/methylation domain-containing protein